MVPPFRRKTARLALTLSDASLRRNRPSRRTVLAASFGLDEDPALKRSGAVVHYLDLGGEAVAEAAGLEAVLAGLREGSQDDDALLAGVIPVLDSLHRHFARGER